MESAICQMMFCFTFSRSFLLKMLLRQVLCPRDGDHSGFQFSISTLSNIDILDMGINVCYDHSLPLLMHPFSDEVFTNPSKLENLQFNCLAFGQDLPCSIFSIKTLVVLKLKCVAFKVFSSVELPSLKTLHLNMVHVFKPHHLMELLNGCPNLETLKAKDIRFDFIDPSFKGKGKGNLKPLSKLVRADLSPWMMKRPGTYYIVEFVREFGHADIPIFPNLIHFELILGGSVKMEVVLYLLNHCPQLQTFLLQNVCCLVNQAWQNTPVVPECFSSQLQTCIITKFEGAKSEMTFAKFVMQNSTLLHTMTIFSFPKLSHEKKAEIRIELESCPKSSATCELLFK
ncbi:putative F-box/FBD/LRR-repeat protein At4g13965 [Lotus japonicus]|uniref:putative F-box/FBD/LRR-repeat protein At4g13965 n=1 Tax=Lotus japonicus TaxID=34305 RepID=UPI00258A698A|nr:putative F-box/FBD/LRR-repeat protein At4g13965 [Lotus japonicus]